jgi:hypothetical protein
MLKHYRRLPRSRSRCSTAIRCSPARKPPGSIPPFRGLFGLNTLGDEGLEKNESINFNVSDHQISVSMLYTDYLRVEAPELGVFAE